MRAKAVLGIALAVMLVLAVLPQALAYDVSEDPVVRVGKLHEKEAGIPLDAPFDENLKYLAEKYNKGGLDALTADEAYVLLRYWGELAKKGLVEEKSPQERVEFWIKLTKKYPDYPPAWYGLSTVAEDAGDIALKFYADTRYLELVPHGKMLGSPQSDGTAWMNFADKLEEYGYAAAAEFPRKVYEEKLYEKLYTKDDLRKIGFYEWREKYIMPMYEQRGTLKGDLQAKLARLNALTFGKFYIAPLLLVVTVLVLGYIFLKLFFAGGKKTLASFVFLIALVTLVYYFDLYLAYILLFVVANPLAALAIGAVAFLVAVALVAKKVRARSTA